MERLPPLRRRRNFRRVNGHPSLNAFQKDERTGLLADETGFFLGCKQLQPGQRHAFHIPNRLLLVDSTPSRGRFITANGRAAPCQLHAGNGHDVSRGRNHGSGARWTGWRKTSRLSVHSRPRSCLLQHQAHRPVCLRQTRFRHPDERERRVIDRPITSASAGKRIHFHTPLYLSVGYVAIALAKSASYRPFHRP